VSGPSETGKRAPDSQPFKVDHVITTDDSTKWRIERYSRGQQLPLILFKSPTVSARHPRALQSGFTKSNFLAAGPATASAGV
jgi:hypothetical protein